VHPLLAGGMGSVLRRRAARERMLLLHCMTLAGSAEHCSVSSLTVNCELRCSNVNLTSYYTSTELPPPVPQVSRATFGGAMTPQADPVDEVAHDVLSPSQLASFVGAVSRVEWLPVSTLSFGCFDGRYANGAAFAHGGDFGELLLGLTALEHMLQRELSQAETASLFASWLESSDAPFRLCTDSAAVAQLAIAVGAPPAAPGRLALDLSSPPLQLRAPLLVELVSPVHVGCEHTRRMLLSPESYAVRAALVEQLLRAFYSTLWNHQDPLRHQLRLDVLAGQHVEAAHLIVRSSHWCATEQRLAPLLPSKTRVGSAYVLTADAVAARRVEMASWLVSASSPLDATFLDPTEVVKRMAALGEGQALLSEKAIAGTLRTYSLLLK